MLVAFCDPVTAANMKCISPNPVPRGALLRHRATVRNVGSQFAWATLVNETWKVELHPDTMMSLDNATISGEPLNKKLKTGYEATAKAKSWAGREPDTCLIFADPVSDEWVVEDRWNPLLEKVCSQVHHSLWC